MSSLPIAPARSPILRVVLIVLVTALALAGLALAAAEPAQGQAAPTFPCDGGLYVVAGNPTDMALANARFWF